jgi:hypothetical protein
MSEPQGWNIEAGVVVCYGKVPMLMPSQFINREQAEDMAAKTVRALKLADQVQETPGIGVLVVKDAPMQRDRNVRLRGPFWASSLGGFHSIKNRFNDVVLSGLLSAGEAKMIADLLNDVATEAQKP